MCSVVRCVAGAVPRPVVVVEVGVVAEAEDEVAWAVSEGLAGVDSAALGCCFVEGEFRPADEQRLVRGSLRVLQAYCAARSVVGHIRHKHAAVDGEGSCLGSVDRPALDYCNDEVGRGMLDK